MSPTSKLKLLILSKVDKKYTLDMTEEQIISAYESACDADDGSLQDWRNDIRCSGVDTGLTAPYSRHYECSLDAIQTLDGSWVGFNYWHGGGKYGCPEEIEWLNDAYDLDVKEELKTVRTFKVKQKGGAECTP